MNILEYEMLETLKHLKNSYNVIEIKAEYENEGSRQVELMRLKDIADKADLPIIIKIGGVEAVTDMYQALSIGVRGIIAPMAETPYAVKKFVDAVQKFIPEDNQKDIEFAVNIETLTAYENFYDMLVPDNLHILSSITFGRVDFTASLGKDRFIVDSDFIKNYCIDIFLHAKKVGLRTALGGAISEKSEDFIKKLYALFLIDKYETRKIVFDKEGIYRFKAGLKEAIKFELQWLKSKRRYYHRVTNEDEKRIKMLEDRIK